MPCSTLFTFVALVGSTAAHEAEILPKYHRMYTRTTDVAAVDQIVPNSYFARKP